MGDRVISGCPHGGVLSLSWNIVVDVLLNEIKRQGLKVVGLSEDLMISITGNART